MPNISIKTHPTKFKDNSKTEYLTTADFITAIVDNRPQTPMGIPVMYVRFKIKDKLAELNPESTVLELSDVQLQVLREALIDNSLFLDMDRFVVDFAQDLGVDLEAEAAKLLAK